MEACELLTVELRLDRIEAELAEELPAHLRSFARAHAQRLRPPPPPDVLLRPTTLATARAALVHPVLADRGLALLRLAAPAALEADPGVAAARAAEPIWSALSTLAAARDAVAQARFGRRALDVMHRLHGSAASRVAAIGGAVVVATENDAGIRTDAGTKANVATQADGATRADAATKADAGLQADAATKADAGIQVDAATKTDAGLQADAAIKADAGIQADTAIQADRELALPPVVAGWFEPDGVEVDGGAIAALWEALCARHGVGGALRFERAAGVRPRAFLIEPGREVIVVIPDRVATPAERFAVLHELGHAIAALSLPAGIPRVVDEAAAAYIARAIEWPADRWHSPLARAARARRLALAGALDRIERSLPELPVTTRISERPPWALWHDPGVQAAYVVAEQIADELDRELGPAPDPGALAAALTAHGEPIDRLGSTTYAV